MATEVARLKRKKTHREENEKTTMTLTGQLMEGLISLGSGEVLSDAGGESCV